MGSISDTGKVEGGRLISKIEFRVAMKQFWVQIL